ncbi:MAG: MATE family efflux transporter [Spirochaetaceae bacterium]|nr:MAG: MATE family efflux transporter [Spirochaetaceae bacterium]
MQQHTKRIQMLANGKIGPTLFTLAAPAIAGMLVMAIYNIVDTFFVSLLRDTTAIAATGIVFPIFQLIGAVGLTFGIGAASVISRKLGEKNYEAAQEAAATALYSALVVGIIFSIVGMIFIRPVLLLFGATDSILESATLYGRVIIGGAAFVVVNMTVNNILRAEGASLYSSMGQISGAVLNIVLDPIFIFGLNMGITGAAVATVISQGFSTLVLLSFYARRRGMLTPLNLAYFRLRWETYRAIMTLGVPTFVRQILGSISFGILNNAAGGYGDSAIAALSVTLRLFMLLAMGLMGFAQGLQPLAGYSFGAQRFDRLRQAMRLSFGVTTVVGVLAGLVAFISAQSIMQFFAPQDPAVVTMGTTALRLMAVSLVPVGLVIMFGGIFQALGDGRSALLLAAGQQGLFLIPLVIILPRFFGVDGVFAAQPAGFVLAFLVGLVLFRRVHRTIRTRQAAVETPRDEPAAPAASAASRPALSP